MKQPEEYTMKIVGHRVEDTTTGWTENFNRFLHVTAEFRKTELIVPKGVFRFKTFEEADQWMYRVMIGENPEHPH